MEYSDQLLGGYGALCKVRFENIIVQEARYDKISSILNFLTDPILRMRTSTKLPF